MKLSEAIVLRSDDIITENAITKFMEKLIPNAVRSTVLYTYMDARKNIMVHAQRGTIHSISTFDSSGKQTSSNERMSREDALSILSQYESSGYSKVKKARDFTHIMNTVRIATATGIVAGAIGVFVAGKRMTKNAIDAINQRTIDRGMERASQPSPPPAEVRMADDPDFAAMYRNNPSLNFTPADADKNPIEIPDDVAERIKGEAIDRVIGPNGELYIESYYRHVARLLMDYMKDRRVHPSELPSFDLIQ